MKSIMNDEIKTETAPSSGGRSHSPSLQRGISTAVHDLNHFGLWSFERHSICEDRVEGDIHPRERMRKRGAL